MSYTDLWNTQAGKTAWVDNAPPEQVEWLQGLAAEIGERGSEPTWAEVGRKFRRKFELDRAPGDTTLMTTIRRMVDSG